jgi:hypothetical protein
LLPENLSATFSSANSTDRERILEGPAHTHRARRVRAGVDKARGWASGQALAFCTTHLAAIRPGIHSPPELLKAARTSKDLLDVAREGVTR